MLDMALLPDLSCSDTGSSLAAHIQVRERVVETEERRAPRKLRTLPEWP